MEPSPFVANLSSIIVISLALISFYLMAKKREIRRYFIWIYFSDNISFKNDILNK